MKISRMNFQRLLFSFFILNFGVVYAGLNFDTTPSTWGSYYKGECLFFNITGCESPRSDFCAVRSEGNITISIKFVVSEDIPEICFKFKASSIAFVLPMGKLILDQPLCGHYGIICPIKSQKTYELVKTINFPNSGAPWLGGMLMEIRNCRNDEILLTFII